LNQEKILLAWFKDFKMARLNHFPEIEEAVNESRRAANEGLLDGFLESKELNYFADSEILTTDPWET